MASANVGWTRADPSPLVVCWAWSRVWLLPTWGGPGRTIVFGGLPGAEQGMASANVGRTRADPSSGVVCRGPAGAGYGGAFASGGVRGLGPGMACANVGGPRAGYRLWWSAGPGVGYGFCQRGANQCGPIVCGGLPGACGCCHALSANEMIRLV